MILSEKNLNRAYTLLRKDIARVKIQMQKASVHSSDYNDLEDELETCKDLHTKVRTMLQVINFIEANGLDRD